MAMANFWLTQLTYQSRQILSLANLFNFCIFLPILIKFGLGANIGLKTIRMSLKWQRLLFDCLDQPIKAKYLQIFFNFYVFFFNNFDEIWYEDNHCPTPAMLQLSYSPSRHQLLPCRGLVCSVRAPTLKLRSSCPAPTQLQPSSFPAPANLQPSSYPAPAFFLPCPVLLCSCLVPALFLPCSYHFPALLLPCSCFCHELVCPAPGLAHPSLAAIIIISTSDIYRHGESHLVL